MKKKLLSILLTLCMLFSFLQVTTFADTSGDITLYVKSPLGKSTQITASGDTTIKDIKDKIATDFEVVLDDIYRLCCPELNKSSDRKLADETKTLNDYNFKSGYTIYLEKSSWVSTAESPVTVMGLTISGGTGAQEPYGDYSNSNVNYYWNYTTKTLTIKKAPKASGIAISGTADDEVKIIINGSGWNYITLNNVKLNSKGSACIAINSGSKLDITLKGKSTLTSNQKNENGINNKKPAIQINNNNKTQLRINGDNTGTLTATSNCDGIAAIGSESESNWNLGILMQGGNVIANGGKNAPGIRTDYLEVSGGTVTANSGSGSTVSISIYDTSDITNAGMLKITLDAKVISGGTVTAKEIRNNGVLTFSTYDNLSDSAVYNHELSTKGKVYVNTNKYIYSTAQSKWVLPDYTVKFDTDGGNTLNDKTVKWTNTVLDGVESPTKLGWIFKGWKYGDVTVKSTTTYADLAKNDYTESITLKANWQQGPANTLRLKGNGGLDKSGNTSSDSYTNALTATAKSNPFTKSGYTFTEWNTKADGSGISYKVGDTVSFEVAHNGEVLVLYAIWYENSDYNIKFDTNGGNALNDKTNVKWNDKVLDGVDLPTKSGWEFVEWKYGDITVALDITYAELVKDDTVNEISLTAKWNDIENPVISGIKNGKTYCSAQTVTVSDNDGIATVTVNETPVELKDGKFTLSSAEGEQKIVVTDKTGNMTEMTVTVNGGHTGGTANCKGQAKCEICGESYGEVNADNHTLLKHIEAKSATTEAEGNTEYWYCESCNKYFGDKDGKTQIKLADTVIAKLVKPENNKTDNSLESPKTSDNTAFLFVMFALSGATTAVAVCTKKKKHSAK